MLFYTHVVQVIFVLGQYLFQETNSFPRSRRKKVGFEEKMANIFTFLKPHGIIVLITLRIFSTRPLQSVKFKTYIIYSVRSIQFPFSLKFYSCKKLNILRRDTFRPIACWRKYLLDFNGNVQPLHVLLKKRENALTYEFFV